MSAVQPADEESDQAATTVQQSLASAVRFDQRPSAELEGQIQGASTFAGGQAHPGGVAVEVGRAVLDPNGAPDTSLAAREEHVRQPQPRLHRTGVTLMRYSCCCTPLNFVGKRAPDAR